MVCPDYMKTISIIQSKVASWWPIGWHPEAFGLASTHVLLVLLLWLTLTDTCSLRKGWFQRSFGAGPSCLQCWLHHLTTSCTFINLSWHHSPLSANLENFLLIMHIQNYFYPLFLLTCRSNLQPNTPCLLLYQDIINSSVFSLLFAHWFHQPKLCLKDSRGVGKPEY